jgi:hypothetical protein
MKNFNSFKKFNDAKSQNYLAQSTPKGKLLANRFDSDSWIYKLLLCLATPIKILTGLVEDLAKNVNIDTIDQLIEEWETSVKIPELYPRLTDIEDRKNAIKRKISKYPVFQLKDFTDFDEYSTIENYVYIMTGITIKIERAVDRPYEDGFPLPFPIQFQISSGRRNFLFFIIMELDAEPANNAFPIPFPISFFEPTIPEATQELINKILRDVFPSYCGWVYEAILI